ncbi:MAG: oxidoreductase, partial [Caulobacter sp.]|nr:oxidoreductase [Caulobacter sp.]
ILAAALALAGCGAEKHDELFGQRVKAYLLAHPEVLVEVQDKLREKQDAQLKTASTAAIRANRQALEHDDRDFVANPGGKYTVVEFYDYRCPHCVNIAPQVVSLIQANPDIRFVFKDLPIFGPPSERAARAALYTKTKGGDSLAVYHDLMTARPLDEAAVRRVLNAHGIDADGSEAADTKAMLDKHLLDTQRLAGEIGLRGTPHFVIGDLAIEGEDMDGVQAAISTLRAGKISAR